MRLFLFLLLAFFWPLSSGCTDAPSSEIPRIALREVATGFRYPVHIASPNDGSGRLFVVEQHGVIRIIERGGEVLPEPFLDIRDQVEWGGEMGLLSIAFHPRYAENGYFYVDYTTRDGDDLYSIVSRFERASATRAEAGSEKVLLRIGQPYTNHNGGLVAFGPDGYLYIGKGDGGGANDPRENGQDLGTLLGALLRIDVDGKPAPGKAYAIPPDNPFVGRAGARPEIYAFGLRNPWRFAFDPVTGLLYLADVGQGAKEEIDIIRKGGNYGWDVMEGDICTPGINPDCEPIGILPIHTYPHPLGLSVTGGYVYRGQAIPALQGVYIYGDYVTRRIWGLHYDGQKVTAQRELLQSPHAISSFGQDAAGELYLTDREGGKIMQIVPWR